MGAVCARAGWLFTRSINFCPLVCRHFNTLKTSVPGLPGTIGKSLPHIPIEVWPFSNYWRLCFATQDLSHPAFKGGPFTWCFLDQVKGPHSRFKWCESRKRGLIQIGNEQSAWWTCGCLCLQRLFLFSHTAAVCEWLSRNVKVSPETCNVSRIGESYGLNTAKPLQQKAWTNFEVNFTKPSCWIRTKSACIAPFRTAWDNCICRIPLEIFLPYFLMICRSTFAMSKNQSFESTTFS